MGNSIESGNYIPEFVNIGHGQNRSKLSQSITFKDIWSSHNYGMVGIIVNEEIYLCGGGVLPSKCHTDEYSSTSRCQSFDLIGYTLTTLDFAMTEERTFAQSMMFENSTWLVMGGQDSQGITTDTTEYMDVYNMTFESHSAMPKQMALHCAKMINSSHLFTTGGVEHSSLAQPSIVLPRG